MLFDLRTDQITEMPFQPLVRTFLIGPHEPAVIRHIRSENGGQPAFDAFRGQGGALQPHGSNRLSTPTRSLTLRETAGIHFRCSGNFARGDRRPKRWS